MPTGTAVLLREPMFHVPVDHFKIIDGPRANWMVTMERLAQSTVRNPIYVPLDFTLKTRASDMPFRRSLRLATIFAVEGTTFNFTAIFSGQIVSGAYNMRTHTGWFSLD